MMFATMDKKNDASVGVGGAYQFFNVCDAQQVGDAPF